ncbi:MAG: diguanylate cyclase domain-containing protein [Bacillota bacterium]
MAKLLNKFKYIIIILLIVIIILIFSNQYLNLKEVIEAKYEGRQELVEQNILQTFEYINDAYMIAEQQLNQEMLEYSEQMVEKYQENPDPDSWDLEEMQQDFAGYDIYIVNSDLEIIKTTYEEDLGLDFSQFGNFAKVLRERMEGDSFEVDRLDLSTQAGEIKKYSYMPSPDNKYLFELSVSIEDKYPSFQSLNLFKDATALTERYEMVEDISFYSVEPLNNGVAELRNSKRPYLNPDVPEFEEKLARQAVINNTRQSGFNEDGEDNRRYRFFPALVSDLENEQGWNSYVVGIVYNDNIKIQELAEHRKLIILNIILMLIFFAAFIAMVIYLLRKFEHQANHDKLTGLANRKCFVEKFKDLKKKADQSGDNIGLIFIDIDKFKKINDNYGHDIGDRVLESIASRMENNLKEEDLIARLGGDEFLIALSELDDKNKITEVAERLIDEINGFIVIDDKKIEISVSAGVSFYPEDSIELDNLIKDADSAMYKAKNQNKNLEFEL